ncbi:MAG: DUF4625 domain-containing protein [Flavobacteriaceae bacterium]
MKSIFKPILLFLFSSILFISCTKDDIKPPVISNLEVGAVHDEDHSDEGGEDEHADEGVAHPGESMHIGAEILAFARIETITIDIHSDEVTPGEGEVAWEFEQVYNDAKYRVLNAELHEDITVPANAALGEYHVYIIVTDEAGNSTTAETHFDMVVEEE